MARWRPDAAGRLQQAALELYAECGYEETTVAEIAARAGLTERTYFRHFADKREVLFHGSERLQEAIVSAVAAAPPDTPPLDAIGDALRTIAPFFDERRAQSRRRHRVIQASPELRERELMKRGAMVSALTAVLERRGIVPATAALAAESGISVFHLAYTRWIDDERSGGYAEHVEETLASLRALAVPPVPVG